MTLDRAKGILKRCCWRPTDDYAVEDLLQLTEAFKVFLESGPTEKDFREHLSGVILTSTMLYALWTTSPPKKKVKL